MNTSNTLNQSSEQDSYSTDLENLKILIVATPKTGNTWLKLLLSHIYDLPVIEKSVPDPQDFKKAILTFGNKWISHHHWVKPEPDFINFFKSQGIITISTMRHPGDTLVSLFYFAKWFLEANPAYASLRNDFETNDSETMGKNTLKYIQEGGFAKLLQISASWSPHTIGVVRYENMLAEPVKSLLELTSRIASVSEDRIKQAVAACEIHNLRQTGFDKRFFRKGLQGEWKKEIPPNMLQILRTQPPYPELCNQLGYSFDDTEVLTRPTFDYTTINPFHKRQEFDNGIKITQFLSLVYFSTKNALQRWPNPFETSSAECFYNWLILPCEADTQTVALDNSATRLLITNLAHFIYQLRGDLRQAFPDLFGKNREEFGRWFVNQFPLEYDIEPAFITPMLRSLNSNQTTHVQPPEAVNITPNTTENQSPSDLRTRVKLHDLGEFSEEYRGILSPVYNDEVVRKYMIEQFLDNASVYANHYQNFSHFEWLLSTAQQHLSLNHLEPLRILDIGSGAGNTIFPLFKLYPNASIVASDLSAPLLKILKELYEKDYGARACTIVQLNAEEIVFEEGQFDLVVGSAILHHLLSPERAIKECFRVLKPQGYAIFFEPFESGNSAVASVLLKLLELNGLFHQQDEPLTPEIVRFFKAWCHDVDVRKRMSKDSPLLPQLDDKWLFTPHYFQEISESVGGEVVIYSTNDMTKPFSNAIKTLLKLGLQLEESCLPRWAMDYVLEEEEKFVREPSQEAIMMEGCVVFHKTTWPNTMNITPQTTGIPAPQFKAHKLETITSFCNFLEGGDHPQWPVEIFLEISNVCDLQCAMCAAFSALSPDHFIKLKTSERGFLETADYSALNSLLQHALLVHCFGYGEPTIHPRFQEILNDVLDYEVLVDFFTNGMHLTEELCQLMVHKKLFKVVVSFSGTNQQDYENVYLGGKFETVLEGLSRLAQTKKQYHSQYPVIEINAIAFQHQIDHLIEFIDLMADNGVNQIELKPLVTYSDTPQLHSHAALFRPDIEGQLLEKAKQHAVARGLLFNPAPFVEGAKHTRSDKSDFLPISEIKSAAKKIVPIRPSPDFKEPQSTENAMNQLEDSIQEFLGIQTLEPPVEIPCFEPFETFYVKKSGRVTPCCFGNSSKTPPLGNIHESTGEAIWQGLGFQTIRKGILAGQYPIKICRNCLEFKHYPKHHAIHHKVVAYVDWFRQVFGQEFDLHLQNRTIRLGNLSNRDVIEKWKLLNSSIQMGTAENQFAVSGSIFTLPKRLQPPYFWVEHIPFAFFLIHTLKPRILVELGVHVGNSYNAVCQAVGTLKTATQCYGIDTWQGEEHANFYNELLAYQQREYPKFSALLRMTFDEAQSHFANGTIDVLHLAGNRTYEAVKHDFDNWLPKLSDQGVVIFHDTEVRETDFGVWQFWEELAQTYPSFNFKHGYGLGVIAVGTQVPQAFLNFLQAANQEPFYRELFARLGDYISVLEQHKTLVEQHRTLVEQHKTLVEKPVRPQPLLVAQLFIDTGTGFLEAQSITQPITGAETQLEFDLSAYQGIRLLRFDPLNDLTILEMQQFVIQDGQGTWHQLVNFQTNLTYAKDNYLVFGTNDPQILIDVQQIQRPLKVIFQFKYVTLGEKTYRPLWEMEREQTQQLAGRVQQLEQVFQPQGRR